MAAPFSLERFDVVLPPAPPAEDTEPLAPPTPPPEAAIEAPTEDEPDPAQEMLRVIQAAERSADTAIAELTHAMRTALGEALEGLLPALLADGHAAEIASIAVRIAADVPRGPVTLAVPANDHDGIIAELERLTPAHPVTVTQDTALPAGSARLRWPSGGADIDAEHLLAEAKAVLDRRLTALTEDTP